MHPDPLFRVSKEHVFECGIVCLGIAADGFAGIFTFDQRQGFFEAEHVGAVGLATTVSGQDRRAGIEREDGKTLERTCRLAEKNCVASTREHPATALRSLGRQGDFSVFWLFCSSKRT